MVVEEDIDAAVEIDDGNFKTLKKKLESEILLFKSSVNSFSNEPKAISYYVVFHIRQHYERNNGLR